MSVYTSVSDDEMRNFLRDYHIGRFINLQGIAQGVTNSNYFLTTTQGRYVLTVFEAMAQTELPFYLELTQHLSTHNVACPAPIARTDGRLDSTLAGKPACLVTCLSGSDTSSPSVQQCFNTGAMLAKMHLAGSNFPQKMPNPRYTNWWQEASKRLSPFLNPKDQQLLQTEIAFFDQHEQTNLPSGIIHADLFRDNVLLDGEQVAGFIDFYYACNGNFMYDLAIAVNDWARRADNHIDQNLQQAFICGYDTIRPRTPAEQDYFPIVQRAACIRFWVSRLLDYHFPQAGEITFIKDPNAFRDLLLNLRK